MTPKQQIIQTVRQAIAAADTSTALSQLITFLEGSAKYDAMEKVARLAQAKQEGAKRNLAQGLVSIEAANLDFNAVNNTVLQLIEDLEKDAFELDHYAPDMRPNRWQKKLVYVLAGIFLVLAGGLGYWVYINNMVAPRFTCPTFQPASDFNVLLLPFQPAVEGQLAPHTTIKRRLTNKAEAQDLNISVEIDKDYFEQHDTPGKGEVTEIGGFCKAKLVIWGVWEDTPAGKIIRTDFKYLGETERFGFQKLKLESNDQLDTVFTMSNIETEGTLTQDIEKIIDGYFGLIAGLSGQPQAAIEFLSKSVPAPADTAAFLLNQMTLADSYLAMGDTKAAAAVYDKILEVHPNYEFACNNRGVLLYQEGEYRKAINDLTVQLNKSPDDVDALSVRASAYLHLDELQKAEVDLQKAKNTQAKGVLIEEKTKLLDEKKAEKKAIIKDSTSQLKKNKNNIKALNARAKANKSLGEYELAIQDAEQVIRLSSKNTKAYETIIEAYTDKKNPLKVEEIWKKARAKGIDLTKIEKQ